MPRRSKAKKQPKPIPHFKSIEEEADFWDTHSTTEYGEWEEVEDFQIDVIRGSNYLSFRIDEEILSRIDRLAESRGVHADELIADWIHQGLAG